MQFRRVQANKGMQPKRAKGQHWATKPLFAGLQQSHSTTESTITAFYTNLYNSWKPQLRDQTLCFSAWVRFFPVAETKGWAWCKHNPELVERTVALRNLLLVGSGCLEIPKGMAGMDFLDKHVQQTSCGSASHFENIASWKAGSPASKPQRLKAQSRQLFIGLQRSHSTTESTITAL